MSEFFWKKLDWITGILAIAVLFGLTSFAANLEIKDLDLWLHIKTGQYIVEHHSVPSHDIFSCSLGGKPWLDHEWLFQVIIYHLFKVWGFQGLITMQSIVVTLTFLALLFISYREDRQVLSVFTLLMVLLVYQSRFTIRPDIFSLLFFSLDMYILALCLGQRWSIWALGLIQVFWVNMHGFFLFGPLLLILGLAAEGIKRTVPLPWEWNSIGRLTDQEFKQLAKALFVVAAVSFLNPYGMQGAIYPLKVLFQTSGDAKVFFEHITELQRPLAHGALFNPNEQPHYKILILMSFFSFFFNRRKIDLSVLFLWLVFLFFSLAALRNMVFFACAGYLIILVNSMTVTFEEVVPLRFANARFKTLSSILAKIALICWMLNFGLQLTERGYFDFDTYGRKSEYGGVSKRSFPYKAVDFLVEHNIKGNFFNDFNSGAYLIGRAYPNIKVFIDGRTEVYGGQFFLTYQKIWSKGEKKVFDQMDAQCHFTGALLNNMAQIIPAPAVRLFYGMKDWKLVYFDYDGMVFLKNTPENQPIIAKYGIDLTKWQPPAMDLQSLGSRPLFPFPYINRAKVLLAVNLTGPALKELAFALKIAPNATEIYELLGDIYTKQRKLRLAFENYRIAVMLYPGDDAVRRKLAEAYERLRDYSHALEHYERILADNPKDVKIVNKIKALEARIKGAASVRKRASAAGKRESNILVKTGTHK